MASRPAEKFLVYNLRETYHELGEYEFKIVFSPKHFKNSHLSDLKVFDSDGRPMAYELKKWGRKMNCRFLIDDSCSDGVAVARLFLLDERRNEHMMQLTWWVIKP